MTNEQALARIIFELDDIARCDRTWFARRRLKRLKKAINKANWLALKTDVAQRCEDILKVRSIL